MKSSKTPVCLTLKREGQKSKRNRSVNQFEGELKLLVEKVANQIETISLFQ